MTQNGLETLQTDKNIKYNRLQFSRSPYLLQHAQNPVDWYEWGDEAFEKARRENIPVLLSIGYATCHWCHVMAHESFEDQEVADLLNRHYVCIKVDREERPDIDDFYMSVSQLLTGSGGWPLNIFMMPDKRPFFAMTYLPKRGRQGVTGLMELLNNVAVLWRQQPDRIDQNCEGIMEALASLSAEAPDQSTESGDIAALALEQLSKIYDKTYGGIGEAPKFPMAGTISWLISQETSGNRKALEMGLHTLRMIRGGGIWDHLGGGLHRYAVDRKWLVPHFEKMLYDQAMLSLSALEAFQISKEELYLEMAENIFRFVDRELTAPDGGFYSALDADSEGVEGKYYVWKKSEVVAILGPDSELFCSFYDITEGGNFEGENILNTPLALAEFCEKNSLDQEKTARTLERCRTLLLEQREKRIRPFRDEKVITAWNGLMIAALAKCGVIDNNSDYIARAERAADFILNNLKNSNGRLLRSHLNGPSDIPGFLEDYAFLCLGLIELFEATLDDQRLNQALELAEEMTRLFYDVPSTTFNKTGNDAEQMLHSASLEHDGVIPSAFSVAAHCYAALGHMLERPELHDLAHVLLKPALTDARTHPTAHLAALQADALLENEPMIVTLQGNRESDEVRELLEIVKNTYVPNLVMRFEEGPIATVHVCALGTCYPPVYDSEGLIKLLAEL